MSFDHMSQGELVALSRDATELPRNEKLISLEKKNMFSLLATHKLYWVNRSSALYPYCNCVCLPLSVVCFCYSPFRHSSFFYIRFSALCCLRYVYGWVGSPLSLCGLSSVIICAIAVHGNQHNNDKSLVFHFNFMERDVCSSYKG